MLECVYIYYIDWMFTPVNITRLYRTGPEKHYFILGTII